MLATHDVELAARVADRAVVLADGQVITDGPAREVVCHSPVFAPQVAKVLAPDEWLTVDEVRAALGGRSRRDGLGPHGAWTGRASRSRPSGWAAARPSCSSLTTAFGIAAFGWPLLIHQHAGAEHRPQRRRALDLRRRSSRSSLAIVMAELSEGAIDAKAVALLGILAACFAALRVASPGINGFEPEWFLLILSARVFGRGFGFVLGAVAFFASALITGGVGPWLPFQMLAAAWVGFGAGCLPPARGSPSGCCLAGYGAVAALVYGLLTNFWFWPFVGSDTTYSFVPGPVWWRTCTGSFSSTSPRPWASTSPGR